MAEEMFSDQTIELFHKFMDTWGFNEIFAVAVGECCEFGALFGKGAQGRLSKEMIIDECADVLNMVFQVALKVGLNEVKQRMLDKQERTYRKLLEEIEEREKQKQAFKELVEALEKSAAEIIEAENYSPTPRSEILNRIQFELDEIKSEEAAEQ